MKVGIMNLLCCLKFVQLTSTVLFLQWIKPSYSDDDINCVVLKHCPLALKLVETRRNDPQIIKYLRIMHCGFEGKDPMVWCNVFAKCTTPQGQDGKCKRIKECDSFVDVIKHSNVSNPSVVKYLNEFRCSTVYDPDTKVCCSQQSNIEEECGLQNSDNRIFGGVETELDEYPWMALLKYEAVRGYRFGCGGSLIHSRFVLTAAHCLDKIILRAKGFEKIYSVILGEYDVRNRTDCIFHKYGTDCAEPAQEHEVESFLIHPGYVSGYTAHDIGIIKLPRDIQFTDFIKPICLPQAELQLKEHDIYTISGWGKTPVDNFSHVKRKAQIQIVDKRRCNEYSEFPLDESRICAGGTENGVDACFGDSGGPLMLGRNLKNRYMNFVIGVISYGFGKICGNKASVYTYVPYYVEWIRSNLES